MDDVVGLLTEVFTWVGFGGGAFLLVLLLIASIADGTWLPTRGAVESSDEGPVVRWFDEDGNVSEAPLADSDVRALGGRDMVDIWYRRGWLGRMRLHRHSHAVRLLRGLAVALLAIGAVATIVQLVLLALAG